MKLLIFILVFCFTALAVFGFFAMDFSAHKSAHACWTATAQGFSCTNFNPLAVIAFHAQAFHALSAAMIVVSLFFVFFVLLFSFTAGSGAALSLIALRPVAIVPLVFVFLQRALARYEHSPTL